MKRGISAIVAVVLIVLITVAGVTVIWVGVLPMIDDDLDLQSLDGRVEVVTINGYTVYDPVTEVASVQVKRSFDDSDMIRITVSFSFSGNSFSSEVDAPGSGATDIYFFNLTGHGVPNKVKVSPIFFYRGSEKAGGITSQADIFSGNVAPGSVVYDIGTNYGSPGGGSGSGTVSCSDGVLNQDEVCVDVGGVCGKDESPEASCSDGLDNDCDGLVDGADTDCGGVVWATCAECGTGLFNVCDRVECEIILEGCYFVDGLISGSCTGCAGAVCDDYSDDQTSCGDDVCSLGSCSWKVVVGILGLGFVALEFAEIVLLILGRFVMMGI
jgi:FlaG/FlaF family flagellin (archaellin)